MTRPFTLTTLLLASACAPDAVRDPGGAGTASPDGPPVATDDTAESDTAEADTGPPVGDTAEPLGVDVAPFDGDTAQLPLVAHRFTPHAGDRTVVVGDAVSAPAGDREDFVAFTTIASDNTTTRVTATLTCTGAPVRAEVLDVDGVRQASVACGETRQLTLRTHADFVARVFPSEVSGQVHSTWQLVLEN